MENYLLPQEKNSSIKQLKGIDPTSVHQYTPDGPFFILTHFPDGYIIIVPDGEMIGYNHAKIKHSETGQILPGAAEVCFSDDTETRILLFIDLIKVIP